MSALGTEFYETDVDWELEQFGNARELWAPVPLSPPEGAAPVPVRSAGGTVRGSAPPLGRQLVRRGGPVLHALFDQVLTVEPLFVRRGAHDVPLLLAAKTLEAAFYLTLIRPIEQGNPRTGIVPELLNLLDGERGYTYTGQNKEALKKWMGTRAHSVVTFGTVCQLVDVLQRFHGNRTLPRSVYGVLRAGFDAGFSDLLLGAPDLKDTLLQLNRLRNRVAHPATLPTPGEYDWFKDAVVDHTAFRAWYEHGPRTAPPPDDRGVLHHLLANLRPSFAPPLSAREEAFERLHVLAPSADAPAPAPADDRFRVDAAVLPDDRQWGRVPTRSVGVGRTPPGRPFREGDAIRFRVHPNRAARVRVIDCDPDAAESFTLLWPNLWDGDRPIGPQDALAFPKTTYPDPFHLQGGAGEKFLLVLADENPPPPAFDAAHDRLPHVGAEDVVRWLDAAGPSVPTRAVSVVRYNVEQRR